MTRFGKASREAVPTSARTPMSRGGWTASGEAARSETKSSEVNRAELQSNGSQGGLR